MALVVGAAFWSASAPAGLKVATAIVKITKADSSMEGYLAKPAQGDHLAAVLLVPGANGLDGHVLAVARELAALDFVALAIDYDPGHISQQSELVRNVSEGQLSARLGAALEWLRAQRSVDGERIGAISWAQGSAGVLKLAQQGQFRSAVVLEGDSCAGIDKLLQATSPPVLVLVSRRASACKLQPTGVHEVSFLDSSPETFDTAPKNAKSMVYEFLAKNMKGPRGTASNPASLTGEPIASIRDIMRVINADDGVRGKLAQLLASPPSSAEQWDEARSVTAVLAESGNLLLARQPERGTLASWRQHATDFRTAAEVLLRAVDQHNFPAAQEALIRLPESCAACHLDHR